MSSKIILPFKITGKPGQVCGIYADGKALKYKVDYQMDW